MTILYCGQSLDQIKGELQSIWTEREGKEQVKETVLCSSKILSNLNIPTLKEDEEDVYDPEEATPQGDDAKIGPKMVVELTVEPKS
ncbi:hypothetical protein J1N35_005633 [Gossypium stocksii]|uniref:Uncharacterized protein n=1 Tax=Gossypium stocksii TaxID=47602 RepID=A0A9D3WEW4_9ROSI|nr:hypothetical protein J1N35_005633 [Gossypium stocksii]